eukprot:2682614-Amphidinium_carterae.1
MQLSCALLKAEALALDYCTGVAAPDAATGALTVSAVLAVAALLRCSHARGQPCFCPRCAWLSHPARPPQLSA